MHSCRDKGRRGYWKGEKWENKCVITLYEILRLNKKTQEQIFGRAREMAHS